MNTSAPVPPRTSPHMAVVVSCIALFTDMLIYGILIPLLPLMPAVERAGSSATGLLFAAYAAMMIAATPPAGRLVDRRGPRGPLLVALLGLAAACLLFAVGGPYWLLLVSRLLQGAAAGLGWVASLALIAAAIPLERRGACLGLAMSMVSVGTLVGPPLAGWLARDHGHAAPLRPGRGGPRRRRRPPHHLRQAHAAADRRPGDRPRRAPRQGLVARRRPHRPGLRGHERDRADSSRPPRRRPGPGHRRHRAAVHTARRDRGGAQPDGRRRAQPGLPEAAGPCRRDARGRGPDARGRRVAPARRGCGDRLPRRGHRLPRRPGRHPH